MNNTPQDATDAEALRLTRAYEQCWADGAKQERERCAQICENVTRQSREDECGPLGWKAYIGRDPTKTLTHFAPTEADAALLACIAAIRKESGMNLPPLPPGFPVMVPPESLPFPHLTDWMVAYTSDQMRAYGEECSRTATERAAQIAQHWTRPDTLRLHAGEMTAQELRTVVAVLNGVIAAIRAETPARG